MVESGGWGCLIRIPWVGSPGVLCAIPGAANYFQLDFFAIAKWVGVVTDGGSWGVHNPRIAKKGR